MPSPLLNRLALVAAGLMIAMPSEAFAQRHGGRHGGGWHGGGPGYQRGYSGGYGYGGGYRYGGGYAGRYGYGAPVYYGYRGYGGYPGYYGRYGGGYYGYRHHDHHNGNDAWIAIGAGALGVLIGSVIARPRVYHYGYPSQYQYGYPSQAPAAPATQQCPDGSTIPVGSYCQAPPPPAPVPPMGERG